MERIPETINESDHKKKIIKNLFNDLFPYEDLYFKTEFFNYIESSDLNDEFHSIMIKLFHFINERRESDHKRLMNQFKDKMKELGFDLRVGINAP
jgi:hypothetical protein